MGKMMMKLLRQELVSVNNVDACDDMKAEIRRKTPESNQLERKPADKPAQRNDLLSMMKKSSSRADKKRAARHNKQMPSNLRAGAKNQAG
ncbi:hypothetical protein F511_41996 [Dorcoceras hygrometricum]|uniref:Uncharacterized protein n=1 Tax=Dorcoceras hygrometricum TaxID=472368 RepID=A0A2Z7CS36_9LAMI|nr:hypothetical protein F511_41996 [Dorcoceras hygrometricum]